MWSELWSRNIALPFVVFRRDVWHVLITWRFSAPMEVEEESEPSHRAFCREFWRRQERSSSLPTALIFPQRHPACTDRVYVFDAHRSVEEDSGPSHKPKISKILKGTKRRSWNPVTLIFRRAPRPMKTPQMFLKSIEIWKKSPIQAIHLRDPKF